MQFRTIIKILGQLVALFSITMVPPALVSLIYKDGGGVPFVLALSPRSEAPNQTLASDPSETSPTRAAVGAM